MVATTPPLRLVQDTEVPQHKHHSQCYMLPNVFTSHYHCFALSHLSDALLAARCCPSAETSINNMKFDQLQPNAVQQQMQHVYCAHEAYLEHQLIQVLGPCEARKESNRLKLTAHFDCKSTQMAMANTGGLPTKAKFSQILKPQQVC